MERKTFDCGAVLALVHPGRKRVNSGFVEMASLHLFRVPALNGGTPPGIHIDDIESLRNLKAAVDFALEGVQP